MAAPDTDTLEELPAVYSEKHIRAELKVWAKRYRNARSDAATVTVSPDACLWWCDRWLDEYLDKLG
jgi:hypothetical protein